MTNKVVVLVTCASKTEARRIARAVVESRLAACVNVIGATIDSIYRWKGRVQRAREVLLLMKTSQKKLQALQAAVEHMHSYEVPEFIALPISAGSPAYMRWLDECVQPVARGRKPR